MLSMNADLMGASGYRAAAHQGRKFITLFNFEARFGRFAFLINANDALSALQNIFQQRSLYHFDMGLPLPAHQRQIIFLHPFLT
ncbi:hypothetical protein D3C87_1996760 [compost metagenome]